MSGKTAEPLRKGTLVCVVLKAKNLPNKRSIGKQDPYCVLKLGSESQRTKPDKRGGQHPQWDEQINFDIFEDMEDALQRGSTELAEDAGGTIRPNSKPKKTPQLLKVSCYADDVKEPDFIGEATVDLTDTLSKGEFDEWVVIMARDRYAGEVFLELTYYSASSPPKKKKVPNQPVVSGSDTYGGAGTFTNDISDTDFGPRQDHPGRAHNRIPSSMRPGLSPAPDSDHSRGPSSMRGSMSQSRLDTSTIPSSLRPSASLAQIDTYTPPYAPASIARAPSPNVQASDDARRQSYQDSPGASRPRPLSGGRHSAEPSFSASAQSGLVASPHSPAKPNTRPSGVDPIDALTRPMSSLSFSSINKPLPPPGPPSPYAAPQNAAPYQSPQTPLPPQDPYATISPNRRTPSFSQAPPAGLPYSPQGAGTPVRHDSYATPPQQHEQLPHTPYQQAACYPAPPPPQTQETYAYQGGQYQADYRTLNVHPAQGLAAQHIEPPRSASPGPRPTSAASYHALPPVPGPAPAPAPSVINAQSYYQQQQQSQQQQQQQQQPNGAPPVQYQQQPPPQGGAYAPAPQTYGYRPLPSTQPPQQSPASYEGHQQSHFAPPPTTAYYQPPPPAQYAQQWVPPPQPGPYGAPPPGSVVYAQPPSNAGAPPPQGHQPYAHWAPPPPAGYAPPESYQQAPPPLQYAPPPPGSGHGQRPSYASGSYMVPPPPPAQHPGHYAPYTHG